ncbi:hypothetical protein BD410DRAFT_87069 [Rickenella mellea]|uniref:Uncharacterized protein n=1 Tax=Rickenella mellea TaxID=50990 RepID=A0A4Y7PLL0_9AGAM|nr:hypothetical protein BD410DRAFT_87069 [Rickenella mellea]
MLRTWAIWERSRKVAGILVFGASAYYITEVVCSVRLTKSYRYRDNILADTLRECYSTAVAVSPSQMAIKFSFGSLMLLDGMIFTLILTKVVLIGKGTRVKILKVLVRDGTIYDAVLFAISVANLTLVTVLPQQRIICVTSLANTTVVAQSIGASHIVLSLRKYASKRGVRSLLSPISGIRFAEGQSIVNDLTGRMASDSDEFSEY